MGGFIPAESLLRTWARQTGKYTDQMQERFARLPFDGIDGYALSANWSLIPGTAVVVLSASAKHDQPMNAEGRCFIRRHDSHRIDAMANILVVGGGSGGVPRSPFHVPLDIDHELDTCRGGFAGSAKKSAAWRIAGSRFGHNVITVLICFHHHPTLTQATGALAFASPTPLAASKYPTLQPGRERKQKASGRTPGFFRVK